MKLFCKLHLCPAFLFPKVSDIFACFFFIHTHPRPFAGLLLLPDILMPSFYMNFDIFALYSWFSTYKNAGIKVFPLFLHCLLFDYLTEFFLFHPAYLLNFLYILFHIILIFRKLQFPNVRKNVLYYL